MGLFGSEALEQHEAALQEELAKVKRELEQEKQCREVTFEKLMKAQDRIATLEKELEEGFVHCEDCWHWLKDTESYHPEGRRACGKQHQKEMLNKDDPAGFECDDSDGCWPTLWTGPRFGCVHGRKPDKKESS